jgi:hypothetical protein
MKLTQHPLTAPTEQQKTTLSNLMRLRFLARRLLTNQATNRRNQEYLEGVHKAAISRGDRKTEALAKIEIDTTRETAIEIKFHIIEIGQAFVPVAKCCDAQLPRAVWLRALCVNESEWGSDQMQKYGTCISHVVSVLDLENSSTKDDSMFIRPLKWCVFWAMMNAMDTNPKFGEVIHDDLNEVFNGALGDYRNPSVLERLGVKNAAH